jgi:NAD(P)-dependent dehydrogenase (short-subunit alcohol dehydrogenase family)
MATVLITGSNRGLGLEWARRFAAAGWRVHATCRYPEEADDLRALAEKYPDFLVHRLDVTEAHQVRELAAALRGEPIDLLLSNAGVYFEKFWPPSEPLDYKVWARTFEVNTMGPVRMVEAFGENVARSRKRLVVAISSHKGSIAEIDEGGSYYYRSSKAALNAAMRGLSIELRPRGVGVLLLHPGWVRTRMGGPGAPLSPAESVRGMFALIERFTMADSGRFYRYNGTEIPW